MTPLQYGITLSSKLAPLGLYIGFKGFKPLFKKIAARFASKQVSNYIN